MSEKDYNRQVVKRERIGRATLVIGIDVGNACNAWGFMNKEGNVLGGVAPSCTTAVRDLSSL